MNPVLKSVVTIAFACSALIFALQLAGYVSSRRGERRRHRTGFAVSAAATGLLGLLYFGLVFSPPSPYRLRLDAFRATSRDADPVDLSLWLYDGQGAPLKNVYTRGKLIPREDGLIWVALADTKYTRIPSRSISENRRLYLDIKLNPRRLLTPPDAVFRGTVNLPAVPTGEARPYLTTLRSEDGDYEIRLAFIRD